MPTNELPMLIPAAQWKQIVAVLRDIEVRGPYGEDDVEPEDFCFYCGGYRGYDESHTKECTYLAVSALCQQLHEQAMAGGETDAQS